MLTAAVDDLRRIDAITVCTILDSELRSKASVASQLASWNRVEITWVTANEPAAFRTVADFADFTLVIAPETDRILETRCGWAVDAGTTLLGPPPEVIGITSDKYALAKHLSARQIATPTTVLADNFGTEFPGPYVLKLRRGAGSQETMVFPHNTQPATINLAATETGEMIVQPLVPGLAASVSFLIGTRRTFELPATEQFVSVAGNLRYLGGKSPITAQLAARATRIARQAIDAIPGMIGYVSVDVVLGSPQDGSGDYVIEVNSRLTSSYIGLRKMTDSNLMELLVRVAEGESPSNPHWRSQEVSWTV